MKVEDVTALGGGEWKYVEWEYGYFLLQAEETA